MRIFTVLLLFTVVSALMLTGLAAYALAARFSLAGKVTERSLALSVTRASGSPGQMFGDSGMCERVRTRVWSCWVPDSEGSGRPVKYRVRVRGGSSCWEGRRQNTDVLPLRISSCIHRWEWRLIG